jgi:hypothetical protein
VIRASSYGKADSLTKRNVIVLELDAGDQIIHQETFTGAPATWSPTTGKRFPIHGATVFVAGLEVWYCVQFHWFSGNSRLQALGVVCLAIGSSVVSS